MTAQLKRARRQSPWHRGSRPGRPALSYAAAALLLVLPAAALAAPSVKDLNEQNEPCLDCHNDAEDEVKFPNGTTLVVDVNGEAFGKSVHGGNTACTGCHRGFGEHPHRPVTAVDRKEYRDQASDVCRRCHYAYYTRVLDGIHFKMRNEGKLQAPSCADCHDAHTMGDPKGSVAQINEGCGRCHAEVYETYKKSVHGKALIDSKYAEDLPSCVSCHGAHRIADPREKNFRVTSHELCARCHGDKERMEKFGLNTYVLTSYLTDFHGVSNRLYAKGAGEPGKPMATCTDCHGVHGIETFEENRTEAVEARLRKVCRRCHEDSDDNFTAAWLSHYPPTLSKAPLVWAITWTYRIMIPAIMFGLIVHILLHLWRIRMERTE